MLLPSPPLPPFQKPAKVQLLQERRAASRIPIPVNLPLPLELSTCIRITTWPVSTISLPSSSSLTSPYLLERTRTKIPFSILHLHPRFPPPLSISPSTSTPFHSILQVLLSLTLSLTRAHNSHTHAFALSHSARVPTTDPSTPSYSPPTSNFESTSTQLDPLTPQSPSDSS